ncbi:MAG: hypothetical protein AB1767_13915 [Bacillota bacterium]
MVIVGKYYIKRVILLAGLLVILIIPLGTGMLNDMKTGRTIAGNKISQIGLAIL